MRFVFYDQYIGLNILILICHYNNTYSEGIHTYMCADQAPGAVELDRARKQVRQWEVC